MNKLSILATTTLPAHRGLPLWMSMWSSLFGRAPGQLQFDACGADLFDGRIEFAQAGTLKLCKINSSPHRVLRSHVAGQSDSRAYKIVAQFQGSCTVEQFGRSVVVAPNEWVIYDTGKPYRMFNTVDVEQYVVTVPRDTFAGPRFMIDRLTAQGFSARNGVGRLACDMLRISFEEISRLQLQPSEDLADSITRLFQQALLEYGGALSQASRSEVLRDRIKKYVQTHLRDPELSIDQLSLALSQTKRNLHRVFAAEGRTISDFIWQNRLDASRRALANETLAHRSITEIAYGCGFSSSAHFSRSFKETYGMSPREYRNGRQVGALG